MTTFIIYYLKPMSTDIMDGAINFFFGFSVLLLHFSPLAIILRRAVDQMPLTVKPGTVARAVIAFLIRIPLKPASHMRAVFRNILIAARQNVFRQPFHRMRAMCRQFLRGLCRKMSLGRKNIRLRAFLLTK